MTITRIGEFQAKPEWTEALHDFLISIMPLIRSCMDASPSRYINLTMIQKGSP